MTHEDDKLPALPMRSVSTQLTDEDLDRLDLFRRSQEDLPSRSSILRDAVRLYLDLQDEPHIVIAAILDGLAVIHGANETLEDPIGEPRGCA
ncbi:ribbon-helix-helix protein, CopG family [Methylobacterium sp. SD21]|uniref:ribbon-helix-helix protein, CopG family n=1 Tax=Methylobacterium litchii TaxID=3138810 RepID=UPI00313DE734